jgi:hypothetical protein
LSKVAEAVEIFNKRRRFYKSIDVRIAAIKQEDSWYNVRTRILLSCDKATDVIERKIDVGNFMILFQNISADSFPTVLETIDRDAVEVDRTKIKFFADQQHCLSLEDWYRKNSDRAIERWGIDWPLDVFRWEVSHKFQNDMSRILESVSERLNCHDPPYEDVYKVVREFLGLHEYVFREYEGGRSSVCHILLPNYLAIKNCQLQGNQLDLEIKFHPSINPSDLRLNIIAGGKTIRRRQESFSRDQIGKYGAFKLAKASVNLEDTADVQLYTFLKRRENEGPSDKRYVRNLKTTINSRFMANDIFEASAEKLASWLHGEGRQSSDDFEHAVSILFHLCGFSAEWLDRGNLGKDAPDILIFSSEPQALIVGECKIDVFGWKEMRKLKDRANRLFQEIKMDTYPTMFTCIKQDDIEAETKEKARNENVTILTSEEINELLRMALRGSEPSDVLNRYFQYGLRYPLK